MSLSQKTLTKASKMTVSKKEEGSYIVVSTSGKEYEVSVNFETGALECTCKGFWCRPFRHTTNDKEPQNCSHCEAVRIKEGI